VHGQFELFCRPPFNDRPAIRQPIRMRDDFLEPKSPQSFMQPQVISPHHDCVDIVMIARYASEMQIDCPPAGEIERRSQTAQRFGNLK
jgi:hypothetical protein